MVYIVEKKSHKNEIEKYRIRNYAWTDDIRPTFTSIQKDDYEEIEKLREPSLTGFHNFTSENTCKAKKRFWLLVYFCCLTLCIVQTGERLNYYLQYPMGMTLNLEKKLTWKYPEITICPFHAFRSGRILNLTDKFCEKRNINNCTENEMFQLLHDGYNLEDIWALTGENIWDTIAECKYEADKNCNNSHFWKKETTVMGTCYTLSIDEEVIHGGPWLGVHILLKNADSLGASVTTHLLWKIFLHENNTVIEYTSYTRSQMIYRNSRTVIMFWKKEYEYINTPINPCVSNEEVQKCLFQCFDRSFLNNSKCKLPFMKTLNMPLCKTPEDFLNVYKVPIHYNVFQNDISACHCGRSCRQVSYDVQTDAKSEPNKGHNRIIIYPTQPEVEIIRERSAYPIISLFSDIGGALGLYLGVSILTILEVISYIGKTSFRRLTESVRPSESKSNPNVGSKSRPNGSIKRRSNEKNYIKQKY